MGWWEGLVGRTIPTSLRTPRTFSLPQTRLRRRRPRQREPQCNQDAEARSGGGIPGEARRIPKVRAEEAKKSRRGRG